MNRCMLFFLSFFLLAGCSEPCVKGTGEATDEKRDGDAIESIELDLPISVIVKKGTGSIVLSGQENVLKIIKTDISSGRLRITSTGCFDTAIPVSITVTSEEMSSLQLNGSGSIQMEDTFQTREFSASVLGSGSITAMVIASRVKGEVKGSGTLALTGSANMQQVELIGSGSVKALGMPCNKADAELKGSGNIYLYALEKIRADIAGSGSVHYKGNADVKSDISGSGTVISEN